MELRQKQAIEAYQRVQRFLDAHPLEPGGYGAPKARLDAAVARLTSHSIRQMESGRKGRAETARQRVLKRELRTVHLRPIAKIANAALRDAPGIEVALRIPRPQLTVTQLLADASAMRNAVAAYRPVFVENSLPETFLEDLDAAITALRGSLVDRAENVGKRVGAGRAIAQDIQRARDVVEILDAIVTRRFAMDDDVMGAWRSARRVHGVPTNAASSAPDADGAAPMPKAA